MSFNSKYTGQEVEAKLDELQNITATDQEFRYKGNKVYHAGNDGEGSGLDADLLDGKQGSDYTRQYYIGNITNTNVNYIILGNASHGGNKVDECSMNGVLTLVRGSSYEININVVCLVSINSSYNNNKWNILQLNSVNFQQLKLYKVSYGGQMKIAIKVPSTASCKVYFNGRYTSNDGKTIPIIVDSGVIDEEEISLMYDTYIGGKSFNEISEKVLSSAEDNLAYWYENNENQSTTTCNRGGNRNVIESLRSKFKRCIAKPYGDDAALISFCNESNSNIWPDGSQMTVDGGRKENRMTYFPKYYHKTVEMSSGVQRTYISEMQLDDDYIEEPEMLLSTFEAYNNNDVLYSGSGLTSTASQTMATFVTQAKANGPLWGIGDYRSHATIARMFCAYYGTTNISTANSAIPCSGGTKRWDNGKTGGTLSLGNVDGKVPVNGDTGYYSTNFLGLEDCYYSKWEFIQGVNVISGKWVVYDGGSFPDKDVTDLEAAGATNIRIAGNAAYNASTNGSGWIKKISHGRYGDVVPTELGGSDSTYYADCYWYNTGNRIVLRSGASDIGSHCGVFVAHAYDASSLSWSSLGSRLAFYGKIVVVDSDDFKKTQI